MSVGFNTGSIVASPGQQIGFSSILSTSSTNNPTYLVVSGLDRLEYTAASNGNEGTISGNGHSTGFSASGGDGTSFGILFTYNATTGQYVNSTYGNLSSLVLTASTDKDRNEAISIYGSNSSSILSQYRNDAVDLSVYGASSYLGTLDVVTQHSFGTAPAQATPDSLAAVAQTFVGQAWNDSGCWVLACNIAAEAGASLPVISTLTGIAGQANGEWTVAFNGPAGSTGDWKSMLRTGDVVVFTTASGGGHVTTVASGSGSTAQLIDNIEYVNGSGAIVNPANDGSANDVVVSAPHAASAEFNGVNASQVVIYRLDTPVVTASTSALNLAAGQTVSLGSMLTAADPANKAIARYQIYDTIAQDRFAVGGGLASATSAATALTLSGSALSSAVLQAGTGMAGVATGTLMVRAFNGTYWGDWTQVAETVTPSSVSDTAATILSNLASLNAALTSGLLTSISLTDAGKPVLTLSAAQFAAYRTLIDRITGSFTVSVMATTSVADLQGINGTNEFSAGSTGGNHTLSAGASTNGSDTLYGGLGADVLNGSLSTNGAAVLIAGSGANELNGGLGGDTLYGGGLSMLNAGAADQLLLGGFTASARDTLTGSSAGHDFLAVASGNNLLSAGDGVGSVVEGGSGADRLFGSGVASGSAILIAGSGANTLTGGLGADTLVAGGASVLRAGTGSQVLLGGFSAAAHDTLSAGSGNSVLAVAAGNNVLNAGTGYSTLFGGSGNDLLAGNGGAAVLVAGSGLSTLQGGAGADTLVGAGQSLLLGGSGASGASVLLGGFSSAAHDTLVAGTGNGETLAVATGNNSLYADPSGQGSNDVLIAGAGNDTLFGAGYGSGAGSSASTSYLVGTGNTVVLGGAGNDNLVVRNGSGQVSFDGGAGTNTVTFVGASDANASITTGPSGQTTISFNNSAQVVTLDHVSSVSFAANGAVHQLAA